MEEARPPESSVSLCSGGHWAGCEQDLLVALRTLSSFLVLVRQPLLKSQARRGCVSVFPVSPQGGHQGQRSPPFMDRGLFWWEGMVRGGRAHVCLPILACLPHPCALPSNLG